MLYVRNLKSEVTEEQLKEAFEEHGKVERVKKIKDYGFVHFAERDEAVKAMNALNGTVCLIYLQFKSISLNTLTYVIFANGQCLKKAFALTFVKHVMYYCQSFNAIRLSVLFICSTYRESIKLGAIIYSELCIAYRNK